jgi:hypothetical protein
VRPGPRYPSLYQINTRVWSTELSRNLGRPATLDGIPDAELDRLATMTAVITFLSPGLRFFTRDSSRGGGNASRRIWFEVCWTSDCFLACAWQGPGDERLLVTVNYAANPRQCYVQLPFADLDGRQWRLEERMEAPVHDRDGCDWRRRGLYLDVRPWQACVSH